MPPKKKARVTATAASPTPSTTAPPSAASPAPPSKPTAAAANPKHPGALPSSSDPWTTAQETALFKALIRYKPTGMHKHFHMLSISSFLRSHGHALLPPQQGSHAKQQEELLVPHTRIPGIWEKLSAIYDLDILDEREDQHALAVARAGSQDEDVAGSVSPDPEMGEWVREFTLPEHTHAIVAGSTDGEEDDEAQFAEMIWQRRFPADDDDKERSSSPPELPVYRGRDGIVERASPSPAPTVGTVQSRSSTTGRRAGGRTRGTKGTPASVTRANTTASRRSSRFGSEVKSSPAPVEREDTQMTGEDEEEQESEEDEGEEEEKKGRVRKGRSKGRGRGRVKKG